MTSVSFVNLSRLISNTYSSVIVHILMYRTIFSALFISIFAFSSCNEEAPDAIIPYAFVNQDLNLNMIQYRDLRNIGGYIYIDPIESGGYKGIIVYHEGNGVYRAFERACTFDPRADCEPITVDESDLFMIHKCCNSTFSFNGNPTGGPASLNLLQYQTYLDGIYLKIINN